MTGDSVHNDYDFVSGRGLVKPLRGESGFPVILDALHATGPQGELGTEAIVRSVHELCGAHGIIGLISRTTADLNRPPREDNEAAVLEYRSALRGLLEEAALFADGALVTPVLHLSIHGMIDDHSLDVELGDRRHQTCSPGVMAFVEERVVTWANELESPVKVGANEHFWGDRSKAFHRHGQLSTGYVGYGMFFNTIQIEWARWLRKAYLQEIAILLADIAHAFADGAAERWIDD